MGSSPDPHVSKTCGKACKFWTERPRIMPSNAKIELISKLQMNPHLAWQAKK